MLFDGDCGFCTSSARLLARIAPAVRILPWQAGDLAALGLTEAACRESVRWVGGEGSHAAGEVAIARALQSAGGPWPAAGRLVLAARPLSGWVYRWVSAHRSSLPGGTPVCRP
ncbi:MAG: thiol-disulfide oxidoreductase DCC family protein [Mycobacteriales bacterium]